MATDEKKDSASTTSRIAKAIRLLPQRYVDAFPLAQLKDFPGNPKQHDIAAIGESIDENGWYGSIVVQDWPETPYYVLAGHGRKDALVADGATHAPVMLVQCDAKTARRIVLVDNRLPEKGGMNVARLAEFLEPLHTAGELRGTGYNEHDAKQILNVPDFRPSAGDDQGKLDEREPIECPKCHHKFHP
jgi:ParB family chromosome partitioning protein